MQISFPFIHHQGSCLGRWVRKIMQNDGVLMKTYPLRSQCPLLAEVPSASGSLPLAPEWVWHLHPRWWQPCILSVLHGLHTCTGHKWSSCLYSFPNSPKELGRCWLFYANLPECGKCLLIVDVSWANGSNHSGLGVSTQVFLQEPSENRISIWDEVQLLPLIRCLYKRQTYFRSRLKIQTHESNY